MENYTITKEQILEIYKYGCGYVCTKLEELYPSAFKKELVYGKWYVYGRSLLNFQGLNNKGIIQAYGFLDDKFWMITSNCGNDFEEWKEATDEEAEEALEKEVIKRFGVNWRNAKIEKCLVHGHPNRNFFTGIHTNQIWNKNGCIYKNGVFAEPLKTKVISIGKAVKILSKKYGQKVEIK